MSGYPFLQDVYGAAATYAGKVWATITGSGGTGMKFWMEDVGSTLNALQNTLGYAADDQTDTTIAGRMVAAELGYQLPRTTYTPTLTATGPTSTPSTWTGEYSRAPGSKVGYVRITGLVTGNWVGPGGYIELSLPGGWTGANVSSLENGNLNGFVIQNPNFFGTHDRVTGVVHPGSTRIRLICGYKATVPGTTAVVGTPGYCTAAASTDTLTCVAAHNLSAGDTVKIGAAAPLGGMMTGQPGYVSGAAATDLFTCIAAHGLVAGDMVQFFAADATGLPTGITLGTTYFVIATGITTTAFAVSTTSGGSAVNITVDGKALASKVTASVPGIPTGLTIGTTYTVRTSGLTSTAFTLSSSGGAGGSAVDITADGACMVQKYVTTSSSTVRAGDDLALDGIVAPFAFTGDGTLGNQDEIHIGGEVFLA